MKAEMLLGPWQANIMSQLASLSASCPDPEGPNQGEEIPLEVLETPEKP